MGTANTMQMLGEVLENAIMFDMAVAGSTNAVLHILAYAYELGIKITLADFEKYAKEIYCINAVIPSGSYTVVDFHYAGGVKQVMRSKWILQEAQSIFLYLMRFWPKEENPGYVRRSNSRRVY